jgi:pimeloyl-ACP methyl ester carboxylesterase
VNEEDSAGRGPELHAYVLAGDGTRLFLRARDGGGKTAFDKSAVHAVLCDGIACDGFIWKYLWNDLAALAPVVHWHYRGHGRSAQPRNPDKVDLEAHADDLSSVRTYMGEPPCVLFGHSMGVQVVLEEMRKHRKGVRGLVLICGSFGKVTHTFKGGPILEMILPKLAETVRKNEGLARAIWSRITPELALKVALRAGDLDPERIHPEDFAPYIQHVRSMDFPMFLRMLSAAGEHSAEDLLPNLDVPTLIVAGEKDTFTPLYLAEWMAEHIPGSELFIVRPGTHVAPLEQPELVRDRVAEFFSAKIR